MQPESSTLDVERAIGARLTALRSARGLTQEQLAGAAGVTKGYVSKIENGRVVPPIGTLLRIARALGSDVAEFLKPVDDDTEDAVSVVRAGERVNVVRGASAFGYDYVSLAHGKRRKMMEPFIFTFPTEDVDGMRFEHEGEEFMHVLSGTVEWEMVIGGEKRTWRLNAGDSIYFESRTPHRGRALDGEAQALIVIYTPK